VFFDLPAACPASTSAFSVFTGRFGDFKPPEHNLLGVPIVETVFETHVGGHIYDRGTECRWARVLAFEPPHRVVARCVRLFHLADCVEVAYQRGGIGAAVELASSRRGKQFDPEVVDAFCVVGLTCSKGWTRPSIGRR
jgi:hypothetical protein